jgi:hypothetical protein
VLLDSPSTLAVATNSLSSSTRKHVTLAACGRNELTFAPSYVTTWTMPLCVPRAYEYEYKSTEPISSPPIVILARLTSTLGDRSIADAESLARISGMRPFRREYLRALNT